MFGEIGALTRSQRVATVIAEDETELLEIRWTALRDLRRRADEFHLQLDQMYRERSLSSHLQATDLFAHLSESELADIAQQTIFESHGEFEWYAQYKRTIQDKTTTQVSQEPVIVSEGDRPDGLILVRSGFARIVKHINHGYKTLGYIGRGEIFGMEEIIASNQNENTLPYQTGLRALGYTDILWVPTAVIENMVLPNLPEKIRARYTRTEESKVPPAVTSVISNDSIPSGLMEFFVERRYINGTSTMLVDMDRCIRCDECVLACSRGHDNNPRFNRHGHTYDHYMVANACMHCSDPVCMIGCPTGAIHRSSTTGSVIINDDTCIGCSTCANSCPYNNIRMVPIANKEGDDILDKNTNIPIAKATKCDLCSDQPGGPACQRACPTDALARVDMRDLPKLADWINK
jgi:Fe-S-cluster-containing dehydrogenase component/CRP-like cAMP-binding protein